MKFNYQARNQEGELQIGTIEASGREIAFEILARQNFIVTFLESSESVPIYYRNFAFLNRITKKDIAVFSRQLSIMFSSEVPLVESLRALSLQSSNKIFQSKIALIANDIDGGTPFSKALALHPKLFSSFYVSIVKSGEISGHLSEVLNYLAEHLEREYILNAKIRGAMLYPSFVVSAFIIVGILMITFVIPKLTTILAESGKELPFITKILIGTSSFSKKYFWVLILIIGLAIPSFRLFSKRTEGKEFLDKLNLRIPIIGKIIQKVILARMADNLSTLIKGGLSITQALDITADVVGNSVYKNIILESKEAVKRGMPISSVFLYKKQVPAMVTQMIQVGERSGKIDEVLSNLANFYQKEVDALVDNLVALIEPILIVVLGLFVAGLVAAILLPIYNISGTM